MAGITAAGVGIGVVGAAEATEIGIEAEPYALPAAKKAVRGARDFGEFMWEFHKYHKKNIKNDKNRSQLSIASGYLTQVSNRMQSDPNKFLTPKAKVTKHLSHVVRIVNDINNTEEATKLKAHMRRHYKKVINSKKFRDTFNSGGTHARRAMPHIKRWFGIGGLGHSNIPVLRFKGRTPNASRHKVGQRAIDSKGRKKIVKNVKIQGLGVKKRWVLL